MTDKSRNEEMETIKLVANQAIKDADSNDFKEAINWGDLSVVDVRWFESLEGNSGYEVSIEEASPDCHKFRAYIRDVLKGYGFPDVEIKTEW